MFVIVKALRQIFDQLSRSRAGIDFWCLDFGLIIAQKNYPEYSGTSTTDNDVTSMLNSLVCWRKYYRWKRGYCQYKIDKLAGQHSTASLSPWLSWDHSLYRQEIEQYAGVVKIRDLFRYALLQLINTLE